MSSSTDQAASPHRRKNQWIGAATLVAFAALVLPWLLTPRFDAIRETGPVLTPLPEAPMAPLATPMAPVPVPNHDANSARLQELLTAPVGDAQTASFVLQVGAFKNRENAQTLVDKLSPLELGRAYLRTEADLTRVYVGPFLSREAADQAALAIQKQLSLNPQVKQYDVREDGQS